MRTLSAALTAAYGGAVQRPAWLVSIGWSTPIYLSSHGTVSFDSKTWTAADVNVGSVRIDAASVAGRLVLGNADDTYGALVLAEGASDKAIRIYGYDAGATATADIVELVACVGGKAVVSPTQVEIELRDANAYVYAPRTFVVAAPGSSFTYLMPAGTILNINSQSYRLERK